ncbi:MAG: aminoacyl-tRNA hydrolase [Phycisphaerae bacterium]|nr:aminoacyl-tRNA hydrolase [Phycisphaerae bacterium]
MKLVVGLGNPGTQYTNTRHNVGFMVVDRLVARHAPGRVAKGRFNASIHEASIAGERTLLAKPTTFMNLSGRSVQEAVAFYKLDPSADLLVVVDDLYLPTGKLRFRPGGGDGGHNGLADVQRALGRDDYPRLRIGVGREQAEGSAGKPAFMDQADFVLSRFGEDERGTVDAAVNRAADAVETFVTQGLATAMNRFNAPDRPPKPPRPAPGPTGPPE